MKIVLDVVFSRRRSSISVFFGGIFATANAMREVHRRQFQIGQVPIEKIWINPKSRDDIPAVLKGL